MWLFRPARIPEGKHTCSFNRRRCLIFMLGYYDPPGCTSVYCTRNSLFWWILLISLASQQAHDILLYQMNNIFIYSMVDIFSVIYKYVTCEITWVISRCIAQAHSLPSDTLVVAATGLTYQFSGFIQLPSSNEAYPTRLKQLLEFVESITANFTPWFTNLSTNYCSEDIQHRTNHVIVARYFTLRLYFHSPLAQWK